MEGRTLASPALGKKIDRFFALRAKRLKIERDAKKIKTDEDELKDALIAALQKAKLDSAKGTHGTVSITTPKVFRATDWPAVFAWIKRTGSFEVLSPRLHQSNIDEQFENDPKLAKRGIPGTEQVSVVKFHATAARSK